MPTPDEFDLAPVDEEDWNSDSYDDMMEMEGVPYDEVFAAGPRGAREKLLRGNVPDPDEVEDRYWDTLDDMMAREKQRLEEDYTLEEYVRNDIDIPTKTALLASAAVDSLNKMVEDAAEDAETEDAKANSAVASRILRAANVGGATTVKQRYRRFVKKETERYQVARDHLEQYRSADDNA